MPGPTFVRLLHVLSRARWVSPVVLLLLWELGSRSGVIPERTLAAPSAVVGALAAMIVSGELPANLLVSFGRAAAGLAIGISSGVLLGLVAGLSRQGEAVIDPLMQIKRTIPVVALSPLFIVWFGIGETPKIALIAFATMFPVYLNLYNGIRGVDVRLLDAARSFGLNRGELILHVILPGALPSLLVGLRYALSIGVVLLVIAEQINASSGLGYLINNARDFMRTDIIVVCLMVCAILGLSADLVVRAVETPLHDHRVWGLVGVLRGAELVQRFHRDEDGALRPNGGAERLEAGQVDGFGPAIGDIHRVANAYDDRVSISIHVYGANIGAVERATYDGAGQAKRFVSGYANANLPNLWDRSGPA